MTIKDGKITITSAFLNTKEKRELLALTQHAAKLVGVNWDVVGSLKLSIRAQAVRNKPWAGVTETGDNKNFFINIRHSKYKSLNERCMVLLHELTHVRQYTTGELVILPDLSEYWKGTKIEEGYIEHVLENGDDEAYENLPWEKEPYKNEKRFLEDMLRFSYTQNYALRAAKLPTTMHEAFLEELGSPYSGSKY